MRGPKSCQNCRKSKQRCDIPDRAAVQPSNFPQPIELSCHRCKILKLPCTIDIPLITKRKRERKRKSISISPPTANTIDSRSPLASSLATTIASCSHSGYPRPTSFHASSSSLEGRREVHIFDPEFQEYGDGVQDARPSAAASRDFDPTSTSQPIIKLSDIQDKMKSFRPFTYLFRLCSAQPDFLAPTNNEQSQSPPLNEILERYNALLDWEEMNAHLREYELFMPFLEPFNLHDPVPLRAGLYHATSLYLAALRTDLIDLQVELIVYLRQHALSCVVRGPANAGEAAALVALSLYEPLLLVNSVEEMQLDGSGLLAAASTASKSLDLERVPSMMRSFDLHSGRDPTGLLKQCSLWVTIAFLSGINILAGNLYQRPLVECALQDLNDVELFCKRSLEVPGASHWSEQVSLLLNLIFRYRTLRDFIDIAIGQLAALQGIPVTPFDEAEACLGEGVSRSFACANDVLNRLQALRYRLCLDDLTCDIFMDWIEFETEHLHMLCVLNFTEMCILRIASTYGRPMNLQSLVQRLMQDERAIMFTAVVGVPKCEISKKVSVLFSNFASRWIGSRIEQQQQTTHRDQSILSLAIPPAHLCAMTLLNIKCLADNVGGSFQLGKSPRNCLDDREVGTIVQLCRGHAESLRFFALHQNEQLFQAKGHRDICRMTAGIAIRTSNAIYEWTAASKGLRSAIQPRRANRSAHLPPFNNATSTTRGDHPSKATCLISHPPAHADPQDFDRILEEILSTPILYT